MQIGKYKIGRYHAIIKEIYEDGSKSYETIFSSKEDLKQSEIALYECIGKTVGIATEHPRILKDIQIITGKDKIVRELGCH